MIQANECPVVLLTDEPADVDKIGPHAKCARTVAQLLRTSAKGITVGLVGAWGSGKSTVIRLLGRELSESDHSAMLVYDTWAHEGDPLRRSFIELLIAELSGKGWVAKKKWQRALRRLIGREKERTEITNPVLTGWGWCYLFAIVLVPIGSVVLADSLRAGRSQVGMSTAIYWPALFGLLMMLAPALVALLATLDLVAQSVQEDDSWEFIRANVGARLAPFVKQGSSISETFTKEDGEPTSVEFAQVYSRLMKEALTATERHLVVVLDNLDRVDRETAQRLWGTLQTFLLPNLVPGIAGKISLIIPYDREALKRIWADETVPVERHVDPLAKDGEPTPFTGIRPATDIAESHIAKAVQVVVEVPPPVLSNWRDYLLELLAAAFPRHTTSEFHEVYQLYDSFLVEHNQWVTPRKLKLFVNELVAVHIRFGHDPTLVVQAFYVLISRFKGDVATWLLGQKPTNPTQRRILGADPFDALAALAFAVPREDAIQVLVGQQIRGLLGSGNGEGLRGLVKQSHAIALEVEREVRNIQARAVDQAGEAHLNALIAIASSGVVEAAEEVVGKDIVTTLRQLVKGLPAEAAMSSEVAGAIAWCIARPEFRDDARAIAQWYGASASAQTKIDEVQPSPGIVLPVVTALLQLRREASDLGDITLPLSGPAANIMAVAHSALQAGDDTLSVLLTDATTSLLLKSLGDEMGSGRWTSNSSDLLAALLRLDADSATDGLEVAAATALRSDGAANTEAVPPLLASLDTLRKYGRTLADVQEVVAEGHLLSHLAIAEEQGAREAADALMYEMIARRPGLEFSGLPGQASRGLQLLEGLNEERAASLANRLVSEGIARVVLDLDVDRGVRGLGTRLCGAIIRGVVPPDFVSASEVIQHWAFLAEASGESIAVLGGVRADRVAEALVSEPWNEERWRIARRLRALDAPATTKRLAGWMRSGLDAITVEGWSQRIAAPVDGLAPLSDYHEWTRPEPVLMPALKQALIQEVKVRITADEAARESLLACRDSINRFGDEDAGYIRREIADEMVKHEANISPVFLDIFASEIAKEDQPFVSGAIIRQCLKAFVVTRHPRGIGWVESMAAAEASKLYKANSGELTALAELLEALVADAQASEELKATATRAGSSLRKHLERTAKAGGKKKKDAS